jgi:hypothetical protein
MRRRDFLQKVVAGTVLFPSLVACEKPDFPFKVRTRENASGLAHRLISKDFPVASSFKKTETLVIGAGVAGLTVGWYLSKQGRIDFEVLEVGKEFGGNAAYGQNEYTKFPWAAHYLPIPDNENHSLLVFLQECGVITGSEDGLPTYNEHYLSFAPQEALWIHKHWQENLVPHSSLNEQERAEISRFFALMQDFKAMKGKDGRYFFTVPKSLGSTDPELDYLDKISFSEFTEKHNFHSPFLKWYLLYCCQDEYGSSPEKLNAWSGIHYFASRRANGSNCSENHYLVWPEGNGFLTDALAKPFLSKIKCQHVCFDVEATREGVVCLVYDALRNTTIRYEAKKCVVCTPLFISKRLLSRYFDVNTLHFLSKLEYYPWLTANIVFTKIKPFEPAWDNVFFKNASLGLVYAQHQSLSQVHNKKTFTFYKNFSHQSAKQERMALYDSSEEVIINTILSDTRDFYFQPEDIESIHYNLIGHGMVSPGIGISKSSVLQALSQSIEQNIYLAHSDLSGYSVFEEAFDHGTRVAKELVKSMYF